MTRKRKSFSQAFKLRAVKLVLEENQSVTDVARTLDITVGSLNRWIRAWKDHNEHAFPGHGKRRTAADQTAQVR